MRLLIRRGYCVVWVEADVEGTVTHLVSKVGIDPLGDADTAALAMLLAA